MGNIVTGDDVQTQVILNCNALSCINMLLNSQFETIKKEACWTISNVAAGNRQQIQAVIDANIFPVLITIMQNADFKTKKEAAWAITNATSSGTAEQIRYLVIINSTYYFGSYKIMLYIHTYVVCLNYYIWKYFNFNWRKFEFLFSAVVD